jgi:hypothetical protein
MTYARRSAARARRRGSAAAACAWSVLNGRHAVEVLPPTDEGRIDERVVALSPRWACRGRRRVTSCLPRRKELPSFDGHGSSATMSSCSAQSGRSGRRWIAGVLHGAGRGLAFIGDLQQVWPTASRGSGTGAERPAVAGSPGAAAPWRRVQYTAAAEDGSFSPVGPWREGVDPDVGRSRYGGCRLEDPPAGFRVLPAGRKIEFATPSPTVRVF